MRRACARADKKQHAAALGRRSPRVVTVDGVLSPCPRVEYNGARGDEFISPEGRSRAAAFESRPSTAGGYGIGTSRGDVTWGSPYAVAGPPPHGRAPVFGLSSQPLCPKPRRPGSPVNTAHKRRRAPGKKTTRAQRFLQWAGKRHPDILHAFDDFERSRTRGHDGRDGEEQQEPCLYADSAYDTHHEFEMLLAREQRKAADHENAERRLAINVNGPRRPVQGPEAACDGTWLT